MELTISKQNIDYTQIDPAPLDESLAVVNRFVTDTAYFLNRFSSLCEKKLLAVSQQIRKLETTITILEGKLSSIPGLDVIDQPTATPSAAPAAGAAPAGAAPSDPSNPAPVDDDDDDISVGEPAYDIKQDPQFAHYFKLLRIGVPEQRVRDAMAKDDLEEHADAVIAAHNNK
eukprot:gnl/Trimastix_PCT/1674.p1 GENE.gnl/Trimastix_PCT/1674~~gnl/Trimastix_PCT/1674.p1  ORF type:complete len:172 (-),score=18.91 gnl/Trimastix_PCT/1674:37-552(-)